MPTVPAIFAFGITNLPMLGWLAVAAAPILIHLWSRRHYREMAWAAMEYLLAAARQSRRRLRFEQWLLLLIRTLIVACVVLAVSEPYLSQGVLLFGSGGARTHRVLVIDGSYSMAYRSGDRSRFEEAKAIAKEIVRESPRGDGFSLVLMSKPARAVVASPALEPQEFSREVDALALPQTTADLPTTLSVIAEVLKNARREQPGLEREEVCFLSDMCRVGWMDGRDAAATAVMRKLASELGREAQLVMIDLGQRDAENQAILQLRVENALATTAEPIVFDVVVKNFGRQPQKGRRVELLVDGRAVERRAVDLPPGGTASIAFSHRIDAPGEHVVEARLQSDALDVDNHRWLALPVKPSIAVLCVDGRWSTEEFGGATSYLRLALSPGEDIGAAPVRPDVVPESALLETDLARYDAVFLCDVAQFTESETRVLESYVRRGGGLVIFLGDRVNVSRYNSRLGGKEGLLPAKLGEIVEQVKTGLDPRGYQHPLVAVFRDRESAGLLNTPLEKYTQLAVPSGGTAKVALATASGDPLIVERPFGRGRVILVATTADATWTPMPLWPSYVPLVREILKQAVTGRTTQRNLLVGDALAETVSAASVGATGRMETPSGRKEPLQLRAEGDATSWSFDDTMTSGIYTVEYSQPSGRRELFAINVGTVESDLEKMSEEQLRDDVLPGVSLDYETTWQAAAATPSRIGRRATLARPLLCVALVLLFTETYLAWKHGAR